MENSKLNSVAAELKQKQVLGIKDIVQRTFEQLESLEKTRANIQEQIKILKHDLFDLKDGRLDRILERREIYGKSESYEIMSIIKCSSRPVGNPWYDEYYITYRDNGLEQSFIITNSMSKTYAAGSYKLKDGTVRFL